MVFTERNRIYSKYIKSAQHRVNVAFISFLYCGFTFPFVLPATRWWFFNTIKFVLRNTCKLEPWFFSFFLSPGGNIIQYLLSTAPIVSTVLNNSRPGKGLEITQIEDTPCRFLFRLHPLQTKYMYIILSRLSCCVVLMSFCFLFLPF